MVAGVAELKEQAAAAFLGRNLPLCISLTGQAIGALETASRDGVGGERFEISRELSRCHSNLAAAHLELEEYQKAESHARAAIDLDPSWHKPYLRLCAALIALRRSSDAAADVLHAGLAQCRNPDQLRELRDALSVIVNGPNPDPNAKRQRLSDGGSQPSGSTPRIAAQSAAPSSTIQHHPASLQGPVDVARAAAPAASDAPAAAGNTKLLPSPQHAAEGHQQHALPVTALCGFLGAGKTTLVRHLLACLGSGAAARVGLLVNDLAPANIDAQLLALPPPAAMPASPTAAAQSAAAGGAHLPGELLELSNGCVCCNLRGELQQQLKRLAGREPPLEHLVVECTGVGEPAALAAAVQGLVSEQPGLLELRSMVTVVDASTFLDLVGRGAARGVHLWRQRQRDDGWSPDGCRTAGVSDGARVGAGVHGGGLVADPGGSVPGAAVHVGGPPAAKEAAAATAAVAAARPGGSSTAARADDESGQRRPLAQLLVEQVEAADVVLLNKCDRLLERVRQQQQQPLPLPPLLPQETQGHLRQGGGTCSSTPTDGAGRVLSGGDPSVDLVAGGPGASVATGVTVAVGEAASSQAQTQQALQELRRVRAVVRALNPSADVLPCVRCDVPVEAILRPSPPSCSRPYKQKETWQPPAGPPSSPPRFQSADAHGAAGRGPPAPAMAEVAKRPSAAPAMGGAGGAGGSGSGVDCSSAGKNGSRQGLLQASSRAATPDVGQLRLIPAESRSGVPESLTDSRANEEDEYGIGSYVFRSRLPFHPARLWVLLHAIAAAGSEPGLEEEGDALQEAAPSGGTADEGGGAGRHQPSIGPAMSTAGSVVEGTAYEAAGPVPLPYRPPDLLRAKGFFWLASLPQALWELSLAGGEVELKAVGRWLCTMVDPDHWPLDPNPDPNPDSDQPHLQAARVTIAVGGGGGGGDGSSGGGIEVANGARGGCDGVVKSQDCPDDQGGRVQDNAGTGGGGSGSGALQRLRWHARWGDRCNELVFIGLELGQQAHAGGGSRPSSALAEPLEADGECSAGDRDEGQPYGDSAPGCGSGGGGAPGGVGGGGDEDRAGDGGGGGGGGSHRGVHVSSPTPLGTRDRLEALLRWAQLSPAEVEAGEEVWSAWDDAPWLELLERY